MTHLENYRHKTPLTVRFADLDALGHLNHARTLTYMEQARIQYVHEVCQWQGRWQEFGVILARAEVDYKLPIAFGDDVTVYTRCSRLGSKSFDLEYVVLRGREGDEDRIAAEGKTILVAYDYNKDQAIPIPHSWREQITAYEPALTG